MVERQQLAPHALFRPAGRCVHNTLIGPSGLGAHAAVLFESVWLGSQAFFLARVFNANIGAWNTASMTTMAYVCALCTSLCRLQADWTRTMHWTDPVWAQS
jgi:hypothetical protein